VQYQRRYALPRVHPSRLQKRSLAQGHAIKQGTSK